MTDHAPTPGGRTAEAEKDRIARGGGVQNQMDRGAEVREQNGLAGSGAGLPGTPDQARVMPERGPGPTESGRVPGWLATGAAWSWRLLILAAAIYLVARVLGMLSIVVVPCIVALLLTACCSR